MRLGHLGGWQVRKLPLTAAEVTDAGVTPIEVPDFATVRTNPFTGAPEALGVVGGGYTPLQNEDHAEFLNLLAESGAIFETAGSLRGGRQVFITMQLPDSLTIGGTDRVDLNITALNSHDGSSAFRILATPVRVFCASTQSAALARHEARASIRHTRKRQDRRPGRPRRPRAHLRLRRGVPGRGRAAHRDHHDRPAFDALIDATFGATVDASTPVSTRVRETERQRRDRLHWLFTDADTQAGIRATAWAGYQAVTEYVDHYAPVRTRGDQATARATRLLTSDDPDRIKRRAWTAFTPPCDRTDFRLIRHSCSLRWRDERPESGPPPATKPTRSNDRPADATNRCTTPSVKVHHDRPPPHRHHPGHQRRQQRGGGVAGCRRRQPLAGPLDCAHRQRSRARPDLPDPGHAGRSRHLHRTGFHADIDGGDSTGHCPPAR